MEISELIKRRGEMRRYSSRTIKTYQKCVEKFFEKCDKESKRVSKKDVSDYLYNEFVLRGAPGNTIHVNLNALKFFFEQCLGKRMVIDIKYVKRPVKLPNALSKEEIKKLLDAISNEKHNIMISLMYGAGLRVSELINLRVRDLKLDEGYGFVRAGKGNKDRIFVLSSLLVGGIKKIIENEGLGIEDYLFRSNRNGRYNARSMQAIVKKAAKKAHLNYKEIHCHTLRHSFATHLIENGYSVTEVQAMLGHQSPETTMVYVHLASPNILNIKSPLDSLY